jgi:hypothetical protein
MVNILVVVSARRKSIFDKCATGSAAAAPEVPLEFPPRAGTDDRPATYSSKGQSVGAMMSKENDYRRNAADTMQLAQRASPNEDKVRLLRLAEAWLNLADRTCSTARRLRWPSVLHPLVRKKLDQHLE